MANRKPGDDNLLTRSESLGDHQRGKGEVLAIIHASVYLQLNCASKLVVKLLVKHSALELQQEAVDCKIYALLESSEGAIYRQVLPMLQDSCKFTRKNISV